MWHEILGIINIHHCIHKLTTKIVLCFLNAISILWMAKTINDNGEIRLLNDVIHTVTHASLCLTKREAKIQCDILKFWFPWREQRKLRGGKNLSLSWLTLLMKKMSKEKKRDEDQTERERRHPFKPHYSLVSQRSPSNRTLRHSLLRWGWTVSHSIWFWWEGASLPIIGVYITCSQLEHMHCGTLSSPAWETNTNN